MSVQASATEVPDGVGVGVADAVAAEFGASVAPADGEAAAELEVGSVSEPEPVGSESVEQALSARTAAAAPTSTRPDRSRRA